MRRLFFLMLLLACGLSSCARYKADHDVDFENADRFVAEKKYTDAIPVYEKIAKDSSGSKRGEDALFSAALARTFYDNPQKDFAAALLEFNEFVRVYPNSEKAHDALNWRSILKLVLELKKENEHLIQSIEQLKKIDIRHEERRRK